MPSQRLNKRYNAFIYINPYGVPFSFSDALYFLFSGSSCAVSAGIKYIPAMAADTPG